MKIKPLITAVIALVQSLIVLGQTSNPVLGLFPEGTTLYGNIPYKNDSLQKHLLDIYLPPKSKGNLPVVLWIHGGAWLSNDKYADMGYMKKTIDAIINNGFALVSIDYRFSTQAVFPAQIQDCNMAIAYIHDNASKYGLDNDRLALMGFSAGGHLASLIGLSKNNDISAFFIPGSSKAFTFKAVVDFYGPTELLLSQGNDDEKSPEGILIGAAPLVRPDLAKIASPVTYVDKNDPPFLIIHGEKDDMVSGKHSKLLNSWLGLLGIKSELIIVKDAPHFGDMFDEDLVRNKVISFLKEHLE